MDETIFKAYFENYARGYDTFDAENLATYFYAPTLMVRKGSVDTLETHEDILEHIQGLVAGYQAMGYKKGNLVDMEVKPMGKWSAVVSVHWIIDHVDGSILRDFHNTYNLVLQSGAWKILVITNHDVED